MNTSNKRRSKLKKFLIVIGVLVIAFFAWVELANLHSKNMTYRQKILKAVYPVLMWFTKTSGKNTILANTAKVQPPVSFYDLSIRLGNGSELPCSQFRGQKVLLVNTASDCGYTGQYAELQQLYESMGSKLAIVGFPANDFKQQEKAGDADIQQFCKLNFGVSFPLAAKSVVIKGESQNPVFQWLSRKDQNGWNEQAPVWNFSKYLINEAGMLTHYFAPAVNPLSSEVKAALMQ